MDKEQITREINATLVSLMEVVHSFTASQLNEVPFEDSWTAGQVIRHLIMANGGFLEVMYGPVKDTDRSPDALQPRIKKDFLNFDTKMKSPGFILPPMMNYKKENLIDELENTRQKLQAALVNLDPEKTCLAFELPGYGYLTRLEAVCFINYHTLRHTHQLKNIFEKVTAPIAAKQRTL